MLKRLIIAAAISSFLSLPALAQADFGINLQGPPGVPVQGAVNVPVGVPGGSVQGAFSVPGASIQTVPGGMVPTNVQPGFVVGPVPGGTVTGPVTPTGSIPWTDTTNPGLSGRESSPIPLPTITPGLPNVPVFFGFRGKATRTTNDRPPGLPPTSTGSVDLNITDP